MNNNIVSGSTLISYDQTLDLIKNSASSVTPRNIPSAEYIKNQDLAYNTTQDHLASFNGRVKALGESAKLTGDFIDPLFGTKK